MIGVTSIVSVLEKWLWQDQPWTVQGFDLELVYEPRKSTWDNQPYIDHSTRGLVMGWSCTIMDQGTTMNLFHAISGRGWFRLVMSWSWWPWVDPEQLCVNHVSTDSTQFGDNRESAMGTCKGSWIGRRSVPSQVVSLATWPKTRHGTWPGAHPMGTMLDQTRRGTQPGPVTGLMTWAADLPIWEAKFLLALF